MLRRATPRIPGRAPRVPVHVSLTLAKAMQRVQQDQARDLLHREWQVLGDAEEFGRAPPHLAGSSVLVRSVVFLDERAMSFFRADLEKTASTYHRALAHVTQHPGGFDVFLGPGQNGGSLSSLDVALAQRVDELQRQHFDPPAWTPALHAELTDRMDALLAQLPDDVKQWPEDLAAALGLEPEGLGGDGDHDRDGVVADTAPDSDAGDNVDGSTRSS